MEELRELLRRRRDAREEIGRLVAEWLNASHDFFTTVREWMVDLVSEGLLTISLEEARDGFTKLSISEPDGQHAIMECRSYGTVALHLDEGDLDFLFYWRRGAAPTEWRVAVLKDIENAVVAELTPQENERALERLDPERYELPDDPLDFVADRETARRQFAKRKMTQEEIYRRATPVSLSVLERVLTRLWGGG